MNRPKENKFDDRLSTAAKAREAMLARAKKIADDPTIAASRAERAKVAAEREQRLAQRDAERKAEAAARAERERVEAEARAIAEAAAEAARIDEEARLAAEKAASKRAELDKLATLLSEQKAARDARYAARKARRG